MLTWNNKVKLILADVDETIADVYTDAQIEMIVELEKLLREGKILFLVSGGGLESIMDRVILKISKDLRSRILLAHCAGAEVYGFDKSGEIKPPYYSLYNQVMTKAEQVAWRELLKELVQRMQLHTFPATNLQEFRKISKGDPLAVIVADRGPQITIEFMNGYDMDEYDLQKVPYDVPCVSKKYDLRHNALAIIQELLVKYPVPIDLKFGGEFALDMRLRGVSKELAIKKVFTDPQILKDLGLTTADINSPEMLEIWGDKFSESHGPDFDMSKAVDSKVRSITFRKEDPKEFKIGYNIQVWDGKKHLHEGLLEYLKNRTN